MSIALQEPEAPRHNSHEAKVCIGIALVGDHIQVAARAAGREIAHGSFPAGPLGVPGFFSLLATRPAYAELRFCKKPRDREP